MTDLSEFLLARMAEQDDFWGLVGECKQAHPVRVQRHRAECAVKRRLAEDHVGGDPRVSSYVLRLLALPYADHPDYHEEWKP